MDFPFLSPYLLRVGPLAIHWYSLFMAVSMLLGALYIVQEGRARGLNSDLLLDTALWALLGGVLGARLLFVVFNDPVWFWHNPLQILRIWQGGLAWDGGLLGGILAGWLYLRRNHAGLILTAFDLSIPGLGLGYMLVRMGNIFNHEVLGRPTAFFFGRWPAQVVGSSIGLFLLAHYLFVEGRPVRPGYQFWSAMFYYQVLRGFIEETVRDNPLYVIHWLNPRFGLGVTTMDQLFTPAILILTYVLMRRYAGPAPVRSGITSGGTGTE